MALTAERQNFYMKNGYVIIPNLFSARESQELSLETDKLVAEVKQFESNNSENQFENLRGSQVVLSLRPDAQGIAIKRIVWAADACPPLLDTGRDLKILKIVSQILDNTEADHIITQVHLLMVKKLI